MGGQGTRVNDLMGSAPSLRGLVCLGLILGSPTLASAGGAPRDGAGLEMRASVGPAIGLNGVGVLGDVSGEFIYHTSAWGRGFGVGGAAGGIFRGRMVGGRVGILLALDRQLRRAPSLFLSPNVILGYGTWALERQVFAYFVVELGVPVQIRLRDSWEIVARIAHVEAQIDAVGASLFLKPSIGFGRRF